MDIIGYSKYTINENGEIYNKKRNIIMKQSLIKGYFKIGLVGDDGIPKKIFIHRLLYQTFKLKNGEEMPEIDHINTIKTDNSLDNLRGCTSQENSMNKKILKRNTSGHKNITISKCMTFRFQVNYDNGKYYSKNFKTLEEAIEHRNIKLIELFGEFANNG